MTVDPKYVHYHSLMNLLVGLGLFEVDSQVYHFSFQAVLNGNKPKDHYIQLAVTSLTQSYIELIFKRRK